MWMAFFSQRIAFLRTFVSAFGKNFLLSYSDEELSWK